MAESADPSVKPTLSPEAEPEPLAAPVAALKLSTRRTRERMTANLDALEHRARSAVGGYSADTAPATGQARVLSTVTAVAAVRRLRAMPVRTAAAIGIVTACLVAVGFRRSRR